MTRGTGGHNPRRAFPRFLSRVPAASPVQSLRAALTEDLVLADLRAGDLREVFRAAVGRAVEAGRLDAADAPAVEQALWDREQQVSTAIGHGVAVPHAYLDRLTEPVVLLVRLNHPLNLGAPDGVPTRYLFVMVGPEGRTGEHLDLLTQIARLTSDDEFRFEARAARTPGRLIEAVGGFFRRQAPPPPAIGQEVPAGMHRGAAPLGGVWADLKRRLPLYVKDYRDGLNGKSAASVLFLFFACFAPAITFGGIMGVATDGAIGASEMLVATAACGIVYALIGGTPLILLGGIGPLLIFTGILYGLCVDFGLPFLTAYGWIGLWTGLWLMLAGAFNVSAVMRYFTRFTDEIFAALMSLLFISDAVRPLVGMFDDSFDTAGDHSPAFLSLLLAIGTFFTGLQLARMRRSKYLGPWMREFLSDFGPTLAMGAMTLVALWLRGQVPLNPPEYALDTPPEFGTTSGRPWLVDLFGGDLPGWFPFAAALPALIAAVLIFLAQNITARLVNSPENRLVKGPAYHWDLIVVGAMVAACSLFGLPWLVAATVRTLAHVRALATNEESVTRGGEVRERVLHVVETRLTGLAIHLLIALAIPLLPYLDVVPMAVLYGLFLYMGVVSLQGNQFWERLGLYFTDRDLYPQTHYVRRVPSGVIHKFTALQLLCLAALAAVSLNPFPALRITFPLLIAGLVPVRFLADRLFPPEYVAALDVAEEPEEERTHWTM